MKTDLLPVAHIQARIHIVRGKRVMLDADLARFYGVTTFNLNKAVSRNLERFPEDFAFTLTREEARTLIFQSGISKSQDADEEGLANSRDPRGGRRSPPRAFTEQGVAMLASVLRSPRAVAISVALVRAFAQLRELLATHRELAAKLSELERKLAGHDHAIGKEPSMKPSFAPKGRSAAARRWRREAQRSSPRLAEGESRRVPSGRRSEQMGFHTLIGHKKRKERKG